VGEATRVLHLGDRFTDELIAEICGDAMGQKALAIGTIDADLAALEIWLTGPRRITCGSRD
jgi:hypothetical protein